MGDLTAADLLAAIDRLRADVVGLGHVAATAELDFSFRAACESLDALDGLVEHAIRTQPARRADSRLG